MKILITGATGFIGSRLAEKLACEGHEITALVRKASNAKFLKELGVKLFSGDIRIKKTLKGITKDMDIVFHLAGMLGKFGIPEKLYWDTNFRGTKNILEECLKQNVEKFIYCSSAGVLGPIKKPPADETHPRNPSNIYEKTKAEAEKLVLSYGENFSIVVLRPEFVYGPGDMHVYELFRVIQSGVFPIFRKSFLHPTYIDDLVQAFELSMEKAKDDIYIIAGERFVTVEEFADIIAKKLGISLLKIRMPAKLLRLSAVISEFLSKVFSFTPPITQSRINFFTENRAFDISKAKRELGYRPIRLEEGLEKTIDWYKEVGLL
jgi:nucleoside-diphosphate-sugar epimerase